jgi:hypothetical protein
MKSPGYAFVETLKRVYEGDEGYGVEYIHGRHFAIMGDSLEPLTLRRSDVRVLYSTYMLPGTERSERRGRVMKAPISPKKKYFVDAMHSHVRAVDAMPMHNVTKENTALIHDMLVEMETCELCEKYAWLDGLVYGGTTPDHTPCSVSVNMRRYAYCRGVCVETLVEDLIARGMRVADGHHIIFPHRE